jgi:8-oxo-dGTP diphosphatase
MTAPDGPNGFIGAKVALFHRGRLLTYLRDDRPGLPWPAMWDLPGGGREGDETPEQCFLRELAEEFGLRLPPERLTYRRDWPSMTGAALPGVFFAADLTAAEIGAIRFGDEGQRWTMMETASFLTHPQAVPVLIPRVQAALAFRSGA